MLKGREWKTGQSSSEPPLGTSKSLSVRQTDNFELKQPQISCVLLITALVSSDFTYVSNIFNCSTVAYDPERRQINLGTSVCWAGCWVLESHRQVSPTPCYQGGPILQLFDVFLCTPGEGFNILTLWWLICSSTIGLYPLLTDFSLRFLNSLVFICVSWCFTLSCLGICICYR